MTQIERYIGNLLRDDFMTFIVRHIVATPEFVKYEAKGYYELSPIETYILNRRFVEIGVPVSIPACEKDMTETVAAIRRRMISEKITG